jgi:glycosyltransferase involved in cell wall biosynthesis
VVPAPQTAVVCNGIDVRDLPRVQHGPGRLRIGTSGRISPQKRPGFFAQAAEALQGRADFVWIGDGDESLKRPLLEAGVEITGWRARSAALEELASLSIYVQTSAWEGMPIAVIEAMAAGLPVVATDIVGNRDLLRGTGAGILVDTPPQMIAALLRLMDDEQARRDAGEAGRQVVLEHYSSGAMVRSFYGLYELDRSRLLPARRIADVAG